MRLRLAALGVVPLLAAAIAFPIETSAEEDAPSDALELDAPRSASRLQLQIACPGCFGQGEADDALIFDINVFPVELHCGLPNVTINGAAPTFQNFYGDQLWVPVNDVHSAGLDLTSVCDVDYVASDVDPLSRPSPVGLTQSLIVKVRTVDGQNILGPDFQVSFKQYKVARVVEWRLLQRGTVPTYHPQARLDTASGELHDVALGSEPGIEHEIHELELLEAQARELYQILKRKRKSVKAHIWREFKNLKQDLKECDGIVCALKTLSRQAHKTMDKMCLVHRAKAGRHFREMQSHASMEKDELVALLGGKPQKFAGIHHALLEQPQTSSNDDGDTSSTTPNSHHPLIAALKLVAAALGLGAIFAFLRNSLCCLRRRVERLSDREERRRAWEYRRLARRLVCQARLKAAKERLSRFFRRDNRKIGDVEKRRLVEDQEEVLEKAMEEEIKELCGPDDTIPGAVFSEPGFAQAYPWSAPATVANSLPDYRSRAGSVPARPPSYDSTDEEMGAYIVDGIPIHSRDEGMSESSVADVSPRISAETLRSMISVERARYY